MRPLRALQNVRAAGVTEVLMALTTALYLLALVCGDTFAP